jgi:hypothetical protein
VVALKTSKNSKDSSVGNAEDDLLRIRSWCRELVPGAGWGGTFATCVVVRFVA